MSRSVCMRRRVYTKENEFAFHPYSKNWGYIDRVMGRTEQVSMGKTRYG